jgi:hypothetical protein
MTFKSTMPTAMLNVLKSKFNIIGQAEFKQFDADWDFLENFFQTTHKETFDINDRYIFNHQDTDIYIPECRVGINFRNFFEVARKNDIPFYTILIWTNHIGIQQEIDIICANRHCTDRPTVIESFCTTSHVSDSYSNVQINIEQIQYHALSMMGANRSHRYALYNSLKHIDSSKLAISIKGS